MNYIEAALNTAYAGGIEALVDAEQTDSGNIRGRFLGNEGKVYSYQIDPNGIEFEESHEDSEWINDYFSAQLECDGVEYHGDSAYEYWMGRNGVVVRGDGLNCKTGTPCGNRCIPRGQKCRVGASGASGAALRQGGKSIKRGVAAAVGVGAAGAAIAGGLALKRSANQAKAKAAETAAKAQRSGMTKTVQSMPTANQLRKKAKASEMTKSQQEAQASGTRRLAPAAASSPSRKAVGSGKLNRQSKFTNAKPAPEEKPATNTIPVDETVTKKKSTSKFKRKSKFTN